MLPNSYTALRAFLAGFLAPIFLCSPACKTVDQEFSENPPPPRLPDLSSPPAPRNTPNPSSPIRPGDSLEVFVEEDGTFDGTYRVRESGDILVRGLGRIPLAGLSPGQAEAKVRSSLEASKLRKATVTLDRVERAPEELDDSASVGAIRVFMTGQIARPGQHRLPLPESGTIGVYEAILVAGGFSAFANLPKVHLLRRDDEGRRHKIPVDVEKIERGEVPDPPIGDGDVVVVPEKILGF